MASPLATAHRRLTLLELDPSLLPTGDRNPALRQLTAPALRVKRGPWALSPTPAERYDGWLGMMVLSGLLIRMVRLGDLECCELLGPGDIIRPWERDDQAAPLAPGVGWRALEDVQLAVLDDAFARLAGHWPEVLSTLMQRSMRRSQSLAVHLAIAQARRADVRIMALFWHLADRWGRVTHDGVVVELALTHSLLSRLTCLRRPTVSMTLKELETSGALVRTARAQWRLRGAEPGAVDRVIGLPAAA